MEIMARDGKVSSISTKMSTYFIIPVNNNEVIGCVFRQGGEPSLKTTPRQKSYTTVCS
jgi:hypothetical protein